MHYDLTDLRIFVAVAEAGNLSRGAERCHLAPSSVSLRIKGLEESIGTSLLVRNSRGVVPTAAGQVMLEHARRCLAQLEQMHADLLPYTDGLANQITVFANNNAINSYLPQDLGTFFGRYPSVRIALEERTSHEIVAAVVTGRADIGIVALEGEHPELRYAPYRQDQLVLLVPATRAAPHENSRRFIDCLGQPFISLQSGAALHTFLMNQAHMLGGKLDVRVQVSSYQAIARLVASGAGIGIVPRSSLPEKIPASINVLEVAETWALRDLHICTQRRGSNKHPFRDQLIQHLRGDTTSTESSS